MTNSDGSRGTFFINQTYDCRLRGWYKSSKKAQKSVWAKPFVTVSLNNSFPAITLTHPIFKNISGKSVFSGAIGMTTYLAEISTYLQDNFDSPDRHVFIVDSRTSTLIATSIPGTALYTQNSAGGNVSLFFSLL